MGITFKELVNIMEDRDYYTTSAALIVLTSWFYLDIGQKMLTFILILSIIVRLLFIQNSKNILEKLKNSVIACIEDRHKT